MIEEEIGLSVKSLLDSDWLELTITELEPLLAMFNISNVMTTIETTRMHHYSFQRVFHLL
jgi:hypothetical protein